MGLNYTWKDLLECGTRIYNVERAMQARFGLRRKDDYPPVRCFEEPVPSGPLQGAVLDREKYEDLLSAYYLYRGWSEEGIPDREALESLGLKDVADDLEARKLLG
jgi:aldehyde:ferredoxin oxidoreductase